MFQKIRRLAILIFFAFSIVPAIAQNTLDLVGLGSGATASVAYSLRKLSSSYAGPLLRIQVGASFYDVYPDASTGKFTTASKVSTAIGTYDAGVGAATSNALSSIITAGSTNAGVAIWYDQSGSSGVNLIQDAQTERPSIIASGSIVVHGSAPAVAFIPSSVSHLFQSGSGTSFSSPMSLSIVFSSSAVQSSYKRLVNIGKKIETSATKGDGWFFFGSLNNDLTILTGNSNWAYVNAISPSTSVGSSSVPIISTTTLGGSLIPFVNGVQKNAQGNSFTAKSSFTLGATFSSNGGLYQTDQLFSGKVSEVIFFPSTLSDVNRVELECSQSSFSGTATSNSCGPAITTTGAASACYSSAAQSATLSYSATSGSPTSYSIDWDNTANTAGLTDQGSTSFAFSSGSGTLTGINVPAGLAAATYNGTMTISNGSKTSTKSVSLTINALPTITGTLTICTVSNTQLTGSGTPASSNAWLSATTAVATVGSSGLVTGVSAGSSVMTYTNINGCTKTASITVNALPSITANTGSTALCVGSAITLSNATASGVWSSSNAAIATVNASGLVTGVASGNVNIVYTVTNVATGCTNSSTSAVTVNALPALTTTGTIAAKCFSTSAQTTTLPYTATTGTMNNYSIDWNAAANTAGLSDQAATSISLTTTTTGAFGNALDFDGVNDRVKFNRSIQDDFTIEFWMKTTQVGGGRAGGSQWYSGKGLVDAEVGGVQSDFGVTLLENKVAFGVGYPDKTIYSTTTVNTGNWVHVAVTRNKSTGEMKMYINGVLESSYTHANKSSLTASSILHLGYDTNNSSYMGVLDDVRIWNAVRTAAEISTNYTTQFSSNPSGLVNYFKFNQGTAGGSNTAVTTLTDAVSATVPPLSNFALTGSTSNWVAGYIGAGTTTTSASSGSGNITGIIVPANLAVGTYTGVMTTSNATTGCLTTANVTMTVSGAVVGSSSATTTQSVCLGGTATALNASGVGAGIIYQWYSNASSSNSGGISLGSSNGAQTDTYTPSATSQGTTYYYAAISNGSCAVTSPVFQVNVGNTLNQLGAGSSLPVAAAAYSFRTLGSCYAGPLGRFRVGTDYYDVYPDGSGGLSLASPVSAAVATVSAGVQNATASLLSGLMTASTAGYVGIWYDQSGNGKNLGQSNSAMQPRIINNGTIETENGRPFIRWITKSSLDLAAEMTTVGQAMVVNRFGSASNADGFILGNSSTFFWHSFPSGGQEKLFASNGWASSSIVNGSVWQNGVAVAPTSAIYNRTLMVNAVQPLSPATGTAWNNIGVDRVCHNTTIDGGYAELVVFSSALASSTREAVESNQYSYYITSRPSISVHPQSAALQNCTGIASASLNVTAAGTGLTYQWYSNALPSNSGGVAINAANAAAYTPATSVAGALYYYVVVTGASGLSVASNVSGLVTVRVTPAVTASAGSSVCGSGSMSLSATASAGSIAWYAASSGGDVLSTGSTYKTPLLSASRSFYAVAIENGCATAVRTAIVAAVEPAPTVTVTAGSRCGSGTLSLAATPSSGTVNWYDAVTGGNLLGSGTTFTTPALTVATTYYVEVVATSGCSSTSRKPVQATINAVPAVNTSTDGSYCGTGAVVIGATASVGVIKWYDALTGGNLLSTGNTYTTPSLSVSATYFAEAVNNGCASLTRSAVNATIKSIPAITNAVPSISAGTSTTFCEGGAVTLASTGAAGYALQFNGSSQYVEAVVAGLPTGNAVFTMEAWAKISVSATMSVLNWGSSTGNQQSAMKVMNGHLYFEGGTSNLEGTVTINDGSWHHLAIVYDAGVVSLYVDGILDRSTSTTLSTAGTTIRVARENTPADGGYFTGSIDEIRVWNTARALADIQAHKNKSIAYDAAGLVVSYRFNEGSGTVAGNALGTNNGTIYNAPTWLVNDISGFVFSRYLWTNGSTGSTTNATTAGSYTVTAADADGCSSTSTVIPITVNPLPTITSTTDHSICGSGTVSLGATASGGTIGWYTASSGGAAIATGTSYGPSLGASTTFYVEVTALSCTSAVRTAVVASVNTVPAITGSTGATACISGSVSLAATASAGTVSWYTAASGGTAIASGTTFQTPVLTASTLYYVDATSGTCTSAGRTSVTVVVTPAAVAGTITGAGTVCAGTNSTVLTLGGYAGTISWESSTDDINFTPLGATTASYTATNLSASMYYRAVVTGGCNNATTVSVRMLVSPSPVAGTLSGGGTICSGGSSSSLALTGYTGSIEWYTSTDNTSFTLSPFSTPDPYFLAVDLIGTIYVKAVLAADGCSAATSNVQTITIATAPTIGSITGQGSVCAPTNSLTLTVEDYTGSLQWQRSSDDITYTNIASATASTYTATNTTSLTYYRVVATLGTCTATSFSAMIEVTPSAVSGTVSGATTVCTGTNNTALTLLGYTGNIQWQSSANNSSFADISGKTEPVYFATDLTSITYYRAKVFNACNTVYSTSATVSVSQPSVAGTASGAATICNGTNSSTLGLAGNLGSIQWQSSTDNISFNNISSATNSAYAATNLVQTTYFRAAVTNLGCATVNSSAITITVRAATTAGTLGSDETICSGGNPVAIASTVNGSGDGTVAYLWESAISPYSSWSTIAGATASTYDPPSGLSVTTKYRRTTRATLSSLVCASDPTSVVTVTVNAVPTITSTTPGSRYGVGAVTLAATASAGTINWYDALTGGNLVGSGASFTTPSLSATQNYFVEATSAGCTTSTRTQITATVVPTPLITGVTGNSVCGSGTVALSATSTFGDINWYTASTGGAAIYTGPSYTTSIISSSITYYVDASYNGNLSPTRTAVTATVTPNRWVGTSSGLFSTAAANWSCGRSPVSTDNVLINDAQLIFNADYQTTQLWTISGTTTLTINSGKTLSVPSGGIADFAGKLVTFKSDATGTGQMGVVAGTLSNATNIVVERHIPAGKRAFRFFGSPVTTTTSIKENWMENATPGRLAGYPYTTTSVYNPNPGYGTLITGTGGVVNGFDESQTNNPSLFTFNNTSGVWVTATNTTSPITAGAAYRLYVRGDRSYGITAKTEPLGGSTILRTTGTMVQGTLTTGTQLPALSQAAGGWSLVGNPYQSVVDMASADVVKNNLTEWYYIWDPRMGTRGAYVAYNYSLNTSSNGSSAVNRFVQPGQAFFVQNSSAGSNSLVFKEVAKGAASNQTATFARNNTRAGAENGYTIDATAEKAEVSQTQAANYSSLSAILYYTDSLAAGAPAMDATRVLFGSQFSNIVDAKDGRKFTNLDETMSIKQGTSLLSMELRSLPDTSTKLPLNITQYVEKRYTMRLFWDEKLNTDTLIAYLRDKYTNKETEVKKIGNTDVEYLLDTDAKSSAADRFEVIFKRSSNQVTAVINYDNGQYIKIYPNPVRTVLNIDFDLGQKRLVDIKVYDMTGRLVMDRPGMRKGSTLTMAGLAKGTYSVKVWGIDGKLLMSDKLIKD